jgi:predicted cupin superfamily sugar epimerase
MSRDTQGDKYLRDDDTAKYVISTLGLMPHPEGGHFRETWRDLPPGGGRGHGTAIYFLLERGEHSRWHRVDGVEIWHWYAGSPLVLSIAAADGVLDERLGPDVVSGERPQLLVPAGAWQSATAHEGWALVGCTVSPAFEFDGFELAPPEWSPR